VTTWSHEGDGASALDEFGRRFAAAAGARAQPRPPRVWCTWYQYFEEVHASDVIENLQAIESEALPVDVVQIDDGWSLGTGEWTALNPRFGSLAGTVAAIRESGRRAGIWAAPFSVGASSSVATTHSDWLVGPAGHNWGDDLRGLDLTHPGVRDYLVEVFTAIRELGIDYVKLDFLYAGAIPGTRWDASASPISAYRSGLELIREVLGDDAFLLGCGAPILPSVGLVDAMRVSGDTFHEGGEDGSQGLRGRMSLESRAWQHGRFWINDPDCLVARPEFALRDEWADVVLAAPGIRGFSDRIAGLDDHGRELVRLLLEDV
jgi:alpha-galactosidase